jgi:YVTN family beta-propeller protein
MNIGSMRRSRRLVTAAIGMFALTASSVGLALAVSQHAGPQGDGTAITPIGWRVTPAGQQLELGERPYGLALSPSGKMLLVSNDGVGMQSLQAVDPVGGVVTSTIAYPAPQAVFLGVAFAPDGTHAYASAGGNNLVRTYSISGGTLSEGASIMLKTTDSSGAAINPFPAGLAVSGDGKTLYVADNLSNALSIVDLTSGSETVVPLSPARCQIGSWGDTSNGTSCLFPYAVTLSRDGRNVFISEWGQHAIAVVDTASHTLVKTITVGNHPSGMALSPTRDELYVANTDSDGISVVDTGSKSVTRSISLQPYSGARVGTSPNAIAVAPDGDRLYVADAGNNDVTVIDVAGPAGRDSVVGKIPTGWYPTGVAVDPTGKTLYVANAKGLGAGPNSQHQYIGTMIKGTLSTIPVPDRGELARYTQQVVDNNGYLESDRIAQDADKQHVVPKKPGRPSAQIKHVIYVVNENRTYDQVLGDLDRGNGDPSLTLFGWKVAPNHHSLAQHFTTLDNLYAAGEVSNDGWEWSTGANANTLDQKTWPTNYGGRGYFYTGEGGTLAAAPGADPNNSYIWDRLDKAGISYRSYGFWATDVPPVSVYNEPNLDAHTDHRFAGFNMLISDQVRFAEWKHEFDQYVAGANLPTVEFVKFPRDHTCGTSPACPTPEAMVADSDWATGKLVDAVSHSPYWKNTAIFVVEDDAQDGPDHVDAHRTVAHVVSPYTQIGKVDSTFYSSVSLLRTMELILGLPPLTQFDAAAAPLYASFTDTPRLTPYDAITPDQPLDEMNTPSSPMASTSAGMNFSREDQAPEETLNEAIWKSVKGADSEMPEPRHAG